MISEKEKQFIQYWEANRNYQSKNTVKLVSGLPVALLFSLPVIIFIIIVKLFFPNWYTKISATSPGMFITITIAVLITALFFAFFRMHYKWENNEQLYKEIKSKKEND